MAEYQLYCFAQSGNCYKVALLLALAGADWEPVFVDFFNGGSKTPEYLALNEMGEAPLLLHGDLGLSQSGVILDYLSQRFREFAPASEAERREILRWILWDNHKLTSYLATLRFMRAFVPAEKQDQAVISFFDVRARTALKVLENHMKNNRFIVGDRPTTADLSAIGYLYFPDEFRIQLSEYPNVERWTAEIAALPGWKHPYDLMPGHPRA